MIPTYRTKFSFGRFGGMILFVLSGMACTLTAQSPKMNVLFIAVDDLRPELGVYGHPQILSPHIDRLASRGLTFDRAYCQQAVCAPSRISMLTGMRPDSTQIYDLTHPLRENLPGALSMPQFFKEQGYETLSLGKIYHHWKDDKDVGWTQNPWHPKGEWKGRGYLDPASWKMITKKGLGPSTESPEVADEAYPDGQIAEKAVSELRRLQKQDRPFFLAVGFMKPHLPFNAPQSYWDLYPEEEIRLSPQTDWPTGMPDYAKNSRGFVWEISEYRDLVDLERPFPEDVSRNLIRGYYACVSYTDAMVGRVLEELDRLGMRENTVVILWGDHGWKLSEYASWSKHTNFEIDTRVPMILSVPGQKEPGGKTDALVELVDIFPTLAELCGFPVPEQCEGRSMVPLLTDPDQSWKAAAFSQYPRGKDLMGYSIRSGQWRYTEWVDVETRGIRARELYDHAGGPVAGENLAGKDVYAETVSQLSALLDKGQGWKSEVHNPER